MAVVNVSDFVGRNLVARDSATTQILQAYIDLYEPKYIYKLLGATLGAEYIADLSNGVPQSPRFVIIHDPLNFDGPARGEVYISEGIKAMLVYFIYWHYVIESRLSPSITGGAVQNAVEVGTIATADRAEVFQRYNDGVKTSRAIQYYILENMGDYAGFNGQRILLNY